LIKKNHFNYLVFNKKEQQQQQQVIPEAGYKLLGKMLQYLFPVYIDKKSKDQLIQLNSYLIRLGCGGQKKTESELPQQQQPRHYTALKQILTSLEYHAKSVVSSHHVK
jgi:hypothetical protein